MGLGENSLTERVECCGVGYLLECKYDTSNLRRPLSLVQSSHGFAAGNQFQSVV